MSNAEPVVVTERLSKRYGDVTALDGLSLTVGRGEILGLIGPNGAGKTTAIKILVGLARPSGGRATIAGADCVRESRRIKRLVGYMPDVFGSYENMRVWEYLDFFGAAYRMARRPRMARIEQVMELAGCAYMRDMFVEALSHGMKQRVAIARTLIHDPEVLIMDEPANGLDPQARIEMRRILLRLADSGKTLLVTSHVLPELARICSRVAMLMGGRLRAFGSVEDILRRVRQRRTIEAQLAEPSDSRRAAEVIRGALDPAPPVEVSAAEAVVRFETDAGDEELAGVLAELVRAGVRVSQFHEAPADLEDAFLSVTRDSGGGERE